MLEKNADGEKSKRHLSDSISEGIMVLLLPLMITHFTFRVISANVMFVRP